MNEEIKREEAAPAEETEVEPREDETVTIVSEAAGAIVAKTVNIQNGSAQSIEAEIVHVSRGGVQSVKAEKVHVEQGGIIAADADTVEVERGGIFVARGETVTLHESGACAVFSERAELNSANVVLLAARQVSGEARILFDVRAALVFGAVVGLIVGLFNLFAGRDEI